MGRRDDICDDEVECSAYGDACPDGPFIEFVNQMSLKQFCDGVWICRFQEQIDLIRWQNRNPHRHDGHFDVVLKKLRWFALWLPRLTALFAAIASYVILSDGSDSPVYHLAGVDLLHALCAILLTALLVAAIMGLVGLLVWLRSFTAWGLKTKMRDARQENYRRIRGDLSSARRLFHSEARNDDPERGPIGFVRLKVIERLSWDAGTMIRVDFSIFKDKVLSDAIGEQGELNKKLGAAALALLFGMWVISALPVYPGLDSAADLRLALLNVAAVALASAALAGFFVGLVFRPHVKRVTRLQQAVVSQDLSDEHRRYLGIPEASLHDWIWCGRYDEDETGEYAQWLKGVFRDFDRVKLRKYNRVEATALKELCLPVEEPGEVQRI